MVQLNVIRIYHPYKGSSLHISSFHRINNSNNSTIGQQ